MNDPLEQRVAATLHVRAAQAHVSPDAYGRTVERGARATARVRQLRFAAVTAVAAVAAAVALPLVFDGRGPEDPDVRLTQPPVDETPTDAPPPAPAAPLVWSRAADDSALAAGEGGSYVNDVTAFAGRVIATGFFWPDRGQNQPAQAAIWVSEDGQQWELTQWAEGLFGAGSIDYLVTGGGVAVAVGAVGDGHEPTAWRSVDGLKWERIAIPGTGLPADLVWTGERFLAIGGLPDEVWTSTDGLRWEVRPLELPIEPNATEGMLSPVTLVGDRIVLFGAESVAVSDDGGLSWAQRTLAEAGLAEASLTTHTRIALLPDGTLLAAAPTEPESEGAPGPPTDVSVYVSPDGLSWEPRGRFGTDVTVTDLTVTADGTIVAVGVTGRPGGATVWTSADGGRTWTESPVAPEAAGSGTGLSALTATDSGLVAVGSIDEGGTTHAAAWVAGRATAPRPSSRVSSRAQDGAALGTEE